MMMMMKLNVGEMGMGMNDQMAGEVEVKVVA
jgi:hypothetical protein